MSDWNEYWNAYQQLKYPVTIGICLALGFKCGWCERRDKEAKERRKEALRVATNIGEYNEYKR